MCLDPIFQITALIRAVPSGGHRWAKPKRDISGRDVRIGAIKLATEGKPLGRATRASARMEVDLVQRPYHSGMTKQAVPWPCAAKRARRRPSYRALRLRCALGCRDRWLAATRRNSSTKGRYCGGITRAALTTRSSQESAPRSCSASRSEQGMPRASAKAPSISKVGSFSPRSSTPT